MKSVAATQAREAAPDPAPRPEPAAQPRGGRPAARGGQHFAEVPAAAGRGVPDDDQLTTLLGHIAGQLGIRPGSIRIESGDGAIRITSRAGAPGVTHKGVIHIPQARLSPTTLKGRRLLAHEAAHLAQMQLPAGGRFRKPTPLQAEVEAELFARRYAATRAAEPVRVALPAQAVATYDELLEIVAKNHPLEIAAITDLMSYGPLDWAVTDREVFDVLQILAGYTLPVARGIFRAVDPTARKHFYDNLNPPHFAKHRGEILAACWGAVSEQEFAVTSYDILSRMNLDDLGALEAIALAKVAELNPKMVAVAVEADGVKSKRINDARAYVDSGKATKDAEKELKEGRDGEAKLTADREGADARRKALDEADTSVHTGAITVEGLHLALRYEPGMTRFSVKQLRSIDVAFDAITIADLNVAMSDSLLAAKSMRITGGQVKMGSQSVKDDAQAVWIWNMLGMILNPAGANNAALSFDLMALRSLAMSSGVFIELIEIEGFGFEAGGDASSYIEALIKSVGRLKPRAAAERQAARSDSEHAERHLQEAARIDRQIAKAQEEVDKGGPHGAVVDIGAIRISGVPGVSDKPLNIADIHGQGRSVTAIVPIFFDPTSLRNLIRGRDNASSIAGRQPEAEQFSIGIGRIEAKEPLRLAGGIPTPKKAREEYDDFIKAKSGRRYDEGATPVEHALRDRVTQATRYAALAARGVQNLVGDETGGEVKEFRELRAALTLFEERRATIVEALVLEGVSLNITSDGNPELVAETLKTGVIRTFGPDGAEALTIGGVEGREVAVGAALSGGLANYKEWRKALQSGTLRADQLTLKDIRHAGSGAAIDELSFEGQGDAKGLDAKLDRGSPETGGSSVHVRSAKIVAKGLNAPSHAALLRAEMNRIEAITPKERTKDELKRLNVIGQMLREYEEINGARVKAEQASAKARTKSARAAAGKALDEALLKLKDWQDRLVIEKLTIDQLDLAISGLGDVLAEGYAFDKDAKALKVSGGAQGKPWVQKIEAEGVKTRGATGDQTVAERITLGPIGGDVVRTDKGYAILGLTVASLGVKALSWRSGATTVQSIGETRLEGLSIIANYEKQGGATRIFIVQAGVKQIVADQLRYEDDAAVVTVKSGSLVGITISSLDVTLPDEGDPVIAEGGEIAVEKVRALTIDALAGGKKVAAQVDSRNPADVAAISVSFAKAGERTLSLNGLGAEAEVSDPKNKSRLHVSLKRLSGSVTQNGDDYHVRNLFIGDIAVTDVHWVSSPWTIDVPGKVNGRLDFHNGQVGHPGALEGTITSATVRNLVLQQKSK
ncbi:eCIS core domain-containing protein [Caulobacter sp. LjRoot300]|uniref:eCIS core domain-containing protein n=1 Tax=Caulobacter sp. LjRoot300 TaxID=3342321 RepID=UPI003ECF1074